MARNVNSSVYCDARRSVKKTAAAFENVFAISGFRGHRFAWFLGLDRRWRTSGLAYDARILLGPGVQMPQRVDFPQLAGAFHLVKDTIDLAFQPLVLLTHSRGVDARAGVGQVVDAGLSSA